MGRPLTGLAIVVLLAAGCATRGAVGGLEREMTLLRADLVDLRHAQQISSRDLMRVRDELRALEARGVELDAAVRASVAEHARLREQVDRAAQAPSDAEPGEPSRPVAAAAAVSAAPERLPDRHPVPSAPEVVVTPEREYAAALATFRAREHGQAVLDFTDFVLRHPKHPLAVNAQYWIAEAYYAERDYRHALIEFQKVLEVGPGTPKAGDALVKMGYCHVKLNEAPRARATWERVVREHPRTDAASKARALLAAPPRP